MADALWIAFGLFMAATLAPLALPDTRRLRATPAVGDPRAPGR